MSRSYGTTLANKRLRKLNSTSHNHQSLQLRCPEPFLIYVRTMDHSLGALLAQNNDQGHEQAIYYLSRTMIGAEHRYNPIEKECLALVFAMQKMRHYLVGQTINVISKVNPLRLLMTKPSSLNGRLAKWAISLSQYEMHFLPQKAVKGQAVTDFLDEHPCLLYTSPSPRDS